jgi:uncharacterized sulfatase
MQRMWFLLAAVGTALIAASTQTAHAEESAATTKKAADRPNVVLIISDDHGWTDYGFMGHRQVCTPHLDRLASQSLVFRRGHVPSSLCCPSLASIITGLYPHQHRVTCNDPPLPAGQERRNFQTSPAFREGREVMNRHLEAVPTLPRLLSERGYLSLQTGKWWQGDFRRGGFTHGMTQGQRHGDVGLEIGRKTMQPIFDFIRTAKEQNRPFLVWYAPMMPHDPHTPPDRLLAKYRPLTPSLHVARYWAMVEWFDETCGQLLDYLDQQQLAENTLLLYVADNGWIQNPEGPGPLRSKTTPYEAGLRTPILIRWPGRVTPRFTEELAISVDFAPTILAALGAPPTPEMQGINLLDEQAVKARSAIQGACYTHNAVDLNDPARNVLWRWTVRENWKLIVPANQAPQHELELYDVVADPSEQENLAARHPERVKSLSAELDRWWQPR